MLRALNTRLRDLLLVPQAILSTEIEKNLTFDLVGGFDTGAICFLLVGGGGTHVDMPTSDSRGLGGIGISCPLR